MASSQVEIMSSSQRFGLILRDRNQNAGDTQKKPNAPVKVRYQLLKSPVSDENSENRVDLKNYNNNNVEKSRVITSKRNDNLGAFSLAQIWEARLNRSNGGNSPRLSQSTASNNRGDSGVSVEDSHLSESQKIDLDSKSPDRMVEIESDSGENKLGRVADLIRRLSNEDSAGNGGLSPYSSSAKSNFPMVNFSPRLRRRQAFIDLLLQLERERHSELESLLERNAVSRFTQRGRLQTMLRLRSLKRSLAIQDRCPYKAKTTRLNGSESSSVVLHLREKFRGKEVNSVAAADQRKDHHRDTKMNNKTVESIKVTTESTRLSKDRGITLEAFFAERLRLPSRKIEEATICKQEEQTRNGTVELESKMNCLQLQETIEEEKSCNDDKSEKKKEEMTSSSVFLNQNEEKMEDLIQETQTLHESNEMDQCLEQQETSYLNEWEEQEEYEDEQSYYGETNNEWLIEISRPRSYWEELRKSRYLEVMNTRSEKEDIRRLLERRTVTYFLESGLREQIDKLLVSHVQTHSKKHTEKLESHQEEEEPFTEGEEQEYKDDLSQSSSSQMFASSPEGSWSCQDSEVTSSPVLSVHNLDSPEIELISGMRSQIQQLQQEMSLLRDSVKTCLDVNASLQQSVHRENPLKRKCCVCEETQVEAVLYRCGHMCTCMKCANELHGSGGKCPICRAPIMDVVRVFFDTTK